MKRALLVAGLVLTMATSVISGTLAAYNTSVDLEEDTLIAKAFVLDAKKTDSFDANTKIAPGEDHDIVFTVSNQKDGQITETDMRVTISLDVTKHPDTSGMITPLVFTLTDEEGKTYTDFTADNDYTISYNLDADEASEKKFTLNVEWPESTVGVNDFSFQGKDFGNELKITVRGEQIINDDDEDDDDEDDDDVD